MFLPLLGERAGVRACVQLTFRLVGRARHSVRAALLAQEGRPAREPERRINRELLPDGLGRPGDFGSSGHKKNIVGAINRN